MVGGRPSKRHELVIPRWPWTKVGGGGGGRGREFARVIRWWFEFVRAAAATAARNRHVFRGYTCKRINESQNQQSASLRSFAALSKRYAN